MTQDVGSPTHRNVSPYEWFLHLARNHVPRHTFSEGLDFAAWRASTLPAVLKTLGTPPPTTPPHPELTAQWVNDDISVSRWIIDVLPGLSTVVYVNRPLAHPESEPRPGILCWAGHTGFGMEPVVGSRATEDVRHYNDQNRTDYGLQMAKAGFVTFSVDWLGQGHLDDRRRPLHRRVWPGDPCEYFYLAATMLGMTSLGVNMAIGRALIDFVTTLPFVDADRLGVMGLSYGGTLSVWTALTDDRIRAASVICYSDMFADFGYRDADFCGSQVTPSLFDLVDVPELHGLIAPRPLLVEIGARDEIFLIEPAMKCFERVSRIYEHAGASSNLALDLFEGGHEWHGAQSIPFFEQFLGGSA